jgi:hypothetical protein
MIKAQFEKKMNCNDIQIEKKLVLLAQQRHALKSLASRDAIHKQILGAVDKSYSCAWFGHACDYDYNTYDNAGPPALLLDTCCFCGDMTLAKQKKK